MGTLKSQTNWSGTIINGALLGEPFIPEEGWFGWDGPQAPDGVIDADGNIFAEVDDGEA